MKPECPGAVPEVRNPQIKTPLTLVTKLITKYPALDQNLSTVYCVVCFLRLDKVSSFLKNDLISLFNIYVF